MAAIVVIEDENDLREVLEYNLRQAGHTVHSAAGGAAGVALCRQYVPDLVLLDIMLPDLAGTEVCKAIRRDPSTRAIPVIMLTAKGEEIDRVVGFELGADDYVTKPFSMRELSLRIDAILRRARGVEAGESDVVSFGRLRIDRAAHRVWVDGTEIDLTPIELKLLVALHRARSRVLTRDQLLDEIWKDDGDVSTRAVDSHVKRLREKLGPAAAYVETVRGAGYRFAERPDDGDGGEP
jgi:two-component system phosphate regulon response regulator PhoB